MKKLLLLASTAALFSVNSFAAFVNCTPADQSIVTNNTLQAATVHTCSPNATANNIAGDNLDVIQVLIRISATSQGTGANAGALFSVLVTPSTGSGFNLPAANTLTATADANGDYVAVLNLGTAATNIPATDVVNAFTVTVTGGNAANPLPNSASVTVRYDTVTQPSQTAIPEPSTMALLGSALVGLGVFARRRK